MHAQHHLLLPDYIALGVGLLILGLVLRRLFRSGRDRRIRRYDFGNAARLALRRKRPELDGAQLDLAWQALRDYFRICLRAGKRRVPMPSQLADDAWHSLILDTRRYAQFCASSFGRFLHHLPDVSDGERITPPRRRVEKNLAWKIGRRFLPNHTTTQLPLLFALDEVVGIGDGFSYHTPDPALLRSAGIDGSSGCSSSSCTSDGGDCGDSGGGDSGCSGGCSGGCGGGD
jgi:hypothetical protein